MVFDSHLQDLEGVFGLLNKNTAEEQGNVELDYSEFEGVLET